MEERDYAYWFASVDPLKALALHRLLALFGGSPERMYRTQKWPVSDALQQAADKSRKEISRILKERDGLEKKHIRWVWQEDEAYPRRLKALPDAPLGLYYKGSLPPEDAPAAGIIGARRCSPYGRSKAEYFGKELAGLGFSVISGMAMGIDGYAQAAALTAGKSYALLGCGADICYPVSNRRLYEQLEAEGGLISELPPGTEPLPFHFPLRNRLISAFSDVLLVIEARDKSGTLITVDCALEQGKDVMALPGRVGDDLSAGCNALIRQGAGILLDCGDVLEALHIDAPAGEKRRETPPELNPEQRLVYGRIGASGKHIDELLDECGMEMGALSLILLELEGKGLILQAAGGGYLRR